MDCGRGYLPPSRSVRKRLFTFQLWRPNHPRHSFLPNNLPFKSTVADRKSDVVCNELTTTGLRFATLNIRSVKDHSADVYDIIVDKRLDVLTLTETWHTSNDDLSLRRSAPPGYSVIGLPRTQPVASSATNHGGVAVLFRDRFTASRIDTGFVPSEFEALVCSLRSTSTTVIHVVIYRPGTKGATAKFFSDLTELLEIVATYQSQIVVSGDFNIHVDDPADRHGRQLLDLLEMFDLRQSVQQSTHRDGHTLDLIITRNDVTPTQVRVDPPVYSDHGLVSCCFPAVNFATWGNKSKLVRHWKRLDRVAFRRSILESPLCNDISQHSNRSVSDLFVLYDETLRRILDEHLPAEKMVIKERPLSPWFDSDCRAARRRARLCERRYRRTNTAPHCQAWVRALEKKKDLVRAKQEAYWNTRIKSNADRPKKLWRCLDSLLLRDQNKSALQQTKMTADKLHSFFDEKVQSVRSLTEESTQPVIHDFGEQSFVGFNECSMAEVRKTLLASPVKSCSLDPLPTFLLREFVDELLPFICMMCNTSLQEGVLPESQKAAIITPVLKKSSLDPAECKNYRPISNLTFMSKVTERLAAKQLMQYLQDCKLLPVLQSAYRSGHSTETAVLKVISDIFDAADADPSKVTMLGMLDLSAAFDTVDHEILLERLRRSYGISGKALSWLASFLDGRSQTVDFCGRRSVLARLFFGVPQGSVLGPLLFVLYTADVIKIAESLGVRVHSYADDTQLYLHCPASDEQTTVDQLKSCIQRIGVWMKSNRLKLNADKTQFMWLGTRQQLAKLKVRSLVLDGVNIEISDTAINLGVTLDSELTMQKHAGAVARSCFYQLRQLRSVRRILTRDAALTLVHAFVTSRVDYCNSVFAGSTEAVIKRLQAVLNAAARLISTKKRSDHITPVLRDELHWLPIRQRISYKVALMVYRCLHGLAPVYLSQACIPVSSLSGRRSLRSAAHGDLFIPPTRTVRFGQRSFCSTGPVTWNSLPTDVRDPSLSIEQFKKKLKVCLFRQAYSTA